MTAALIGALEGLDVLLCEKTDQVGGTTSTSAGTVWIPGSSQSVRDGVPDTIEAARRFLDAEIGPRAEAVREAVSRSRSRGARLSRSAQRGEIPRAADASRLSLEPARPRARRPRTGAAAVRRPPARRRFRARAPADRAVHGAGRHDGRQGRHPAAGEAVRVACVVPGRDAVAAAPCVRSSALRARHAARDGQRAGGAAVLQPQVTQRADPVRHAARRAGEGGWTRHRCRRRNRRIAADDRRTARRHPRDRRLCAERRTAPRVHAEHARRPLQCVRGCERRRVDAARAAGAAVDDKHVSPAFYFPSSIRKESDGQRDRTFRTSCSIAPSPV